MIKYVINLKNHVYNFMFINMFIFFRLLALEKNCLIYNVNMNWD